MELSKILFNPNPAFYSPYLVTNLTLFSGLFEINPARWYHQRDGHNNQGVRMVNMFFKKILRPGKSSHPFVLPHRPQRLHLSVSPDVNCFLLVGKIFFEILHFPKKIFSHLLATHPGGLVFEHGNSLPPRCLRAFLLLSHSAPSAAGGGFSPQALASLSIPRSRYSPLRSFKSFSQRLNRFRGCFSCLGLITSK